MCVADIASRPLSRGEILCYRTYTLGIVRYIKIFFFSCYIHRPNLGKNSVLGKTKKTEAEARIFRKIFNHMAKIDIFLRPCDLS